MLVKGAYIEAMMMTISLVELCFQKSVCFKKKISRFNNKKNFSFIFQNSLELQDVLNLHEFVFHQESGFYTPMP